MNRFHDICSAGLLALALLIAEGPACAAEMAQDNQPPAKPCVDTGCDQRTDKSPAPVPSTSKPRPVADKTCNWSIGSLHSACF